MQETFFTDEIEWVEPPVPPIPEILEVKPPPTPPESKSQLRRYIPIKKKPKQRTLDIPIATGRASFSIKECSDYLL